LSSSIKFVGTISTVVLVLLILTTRIVLELIILKTMILLVETMIIVALKITVDGVSIIFIVTMQSTTRSNTKKISAAAPGSLE
jgi:hypothetical protein